MCKREMVDWRENYERKVTMSSGRQTCEPKETHRERDKVGLGWGLESSNWADLIGCVSRSLSSHYTNNGDHES